MFSREMGLNLKKTKRQRYTPTSVTDIYKTLFVKKRSESTPQKGKKVPPDQTKTHPRPSHGTPEREKKLMNI